MLKVPVKPKFADLNLNGTLQDTVIVVPDEHLDLYNKKMKIYAKIELKFETDFLRVYLLEVSQYSHKMDDKLK